MVSLQVKNKYQFYVYEILFKFCTFGTSKQITKAWKESKNILKNNHPVEVVSSRLMDCKEDDLRFLEKLGCPMPSDYIYQYKFNNFGKMYYYVNCKEFAKMCVWAINLGNPKLKVKLLKPNQYKLIALKGLS